MAISQGSRSRVDEALGFELCAGIFLHVSVPLECQAPLDVIPLIRKTVGRERRGTLEEEASRGHGAVLQILCYHTREVPRPARRGLRDQGEQERGLAFTSLCRLLAPGSAFYMRDT